MSDRLIIVTRPWMLLWASCMHIGWGYILYAHNELAQIAVFGGLQFFLDIGISVNLLSFSLIFVSLLAIYALFKEAQLPRLINIALLLPQYFVLIVALISDIYIFIAGEYDGRIFDRALIFAVLWPLVAAAGLHTLALWERMRIKWNHP